MSHSVFLTSFLFGEWRLFLPKVLSKSDSSVYHKDSQKHCDYFVFVFQVSLKKADLDVLIFDIKGHVKIFSLLHVTFDIKEWKKSFKPSKF